MSVTTMTSREFSRDTGQAKRAAQSGPVFITDRGRVTHVLMSMEEYQQLICGNIIIDMLPMPETDDINFEPVRLNIGFKPADLS